MLAKRLRADLEGADALIGVFVFVATFVVIGALFIAQMGDTFTAEARGDFEIHEGTEIVGSTTIMLLDPEWGFNVTPSVILETWDHEAPESEYFSDADLTGDTIEVQVIKDSTDYSPSGVKGSEKNLYSDYIMFYTEWGWWSSEDKAISFAQVMADQVGDENRSVSYVALHDGNYSMIVSTNGPGEHFATLVDAGYFNIKLGMPYDEGAAIKESSMWTILRQLFTASLPDVDPVVNVMISTPFWAGVGFMAVMIVRSFVPFLGG